ncbi:MAG: cytochrome c oxidase subunit CcoM [Ketobacteraceae bacterium]|nr:cytochrome c oxidase subunit CcoM [Ketobacteraceae bacterium]
MDTTVLAGIITIGATIAFTAGIAVFIWQDIKKKQHKH